jgi:hypothetical protein
MNKRARFGDFNYHIDSSVVYSSEDSPFIGPNSYNEIRSNTWRTTGVTLESITFDLGASTEVKLIAFIGPINEDFSVRSTATITIMGNDSNSWGAPSYSESAVASEQGIFHNIPDTTFSTYRYWRVVIEDAGNPLGYFNFGYIYIGNVLTFTTTNIARGFMRQKIDMTVNQRSELGNVYYDIRTPYEEFNNLNIDLISETERIALNNFYSYHGIFRPFIMCLDPFNCFSTGDEYNRLVNFQLPPTFSHVIHRYYNAGIALREVI